MKLLKEFREFLKEYKVMALAIAFVMGNAVNTLVKSLVDDVVMPIATPFIPGGAWEQATIAIGPVIINWGSFLSSIINFLVLALVIFTMVKLMLKQ